MNVETQWVYFKSKLFEAVDTFVPSKVLKSNSGLPWVKYKIRREILKRERLYKKVKRSGSPIDTQAFKRQKRRGKYVINASHDEYVTNYTLIDEGITTKQFWKYVTLKRSYNSSIKCLIRNSQVVTKSKGILNALNETFYEAFSHDEQLENVNLDCDDNGTLSNIPNMPNSEVTFQGIKKLIDGLDCK